jgi:hypothetical protein
MPAAPIAPAVHWELPICGRFELPPDRVFDARIAGKRRTRIDQRFQKEIGRDAPAEVSVEVSVQQVQQEVRIHPEEPFRRFKEFFNEGSLVLLEEPLQRKLQKPVVRVKSFFVSQQVRG